MAAPDAPSLDMMEREPPSPPPSPCTSTGRQHAKNMADRASCKGNALPCCAMTCYCCEPCANCLGNMCHALKLCVTCKFKECLSDACCMCCKKGEVTVANCCDALCSCLCCPCKTMCCSCCTKCCPCSGCSCFFPSTFCGCGCVCPYCPGFGCCQMDEDEALYWRSEDAFAENESAGNKV